MRVQDWPERLAAYVESHLGTPFAWGTHDCTTYAAGAVEAVTGERPALPAYANEREAARLMAQRSLRDRVGDAFGPEIVPALAQRGDLALILQGGERETLGVVVGAHIAAPAADGTVMLPTSAAVAAWRV